MSLPLTVPEAAAHLRCSEWTIRTLARTGVLRGSLVGGRWLFQVEDIDTYLDEQANRAPLRRRRRRAAS